MNRKLAFFWFLISLLGLVIGIDEADKIGFFDWPNFFTIWLMFSLPLIIQVAYRGIVKRER